MPEELRKPTVQPLDTRGRIAGAASSAAFLAAAALLAVEVHSPRAFHPATAAVLILAYAWCTRVRFHAGAGETMPVQIVFVSMLFVLPTPVVPLATAAGIVLGNTPPIARRQVHADRLLVLPANAWFALGPVAVLVGAHAQTLELTRWPVLVGSLGAQFACDFVFSSVLFFLVRGVPPALHLRSMSWVWVVDALLAPLGLLAALASVHHSYAFLLVLPLPVLMSLFARERNERIQHAVELSTTYRGTALLLSDLLERADSYTGGDHTHGVVELSLLVADEMGLSPAARRRVELAALLHDVGKIAIPPEIITKPGPLTDEEWLVMRTHTVEGQKMLDRVGGTLGEVGQIVRASHERFDGRGYPDGLAGRSIPREAAIIAACDAFDAMTTDRPYRDARSAAAALTEIQRERGAQFDPKVVAALERVLAPMLSPERTRETALMQQPVPHVGAAG